MYSYTPEEIALVQRIRYLCEEITKMQGAEKLALHDELEAVLIEFEQCKRTKKQSKKDAWRLLASNI